MYELVLHLNIRRRSGLSHFGIFEKQDSSQVKPQHKLVQMDLKLNPKFVGHKIRRRPYPAPKQQADEIEGQIQESVDAGLVLECKDADYLQHCSPCFLGTELGSTAKRLVVDYGELNKKTLNHSGSLPDMESTLEKIASCRCKTKIDKGSGF